MKRSKIFFPIIIFSLTFFLVFWQTLFVFFVQDDYILISEFSKNGLVHNLINVFGPPSVTHWRPGHNLYFFVIGNLFGKNYFLYHLFGAVIGLAATTFIFLTIDKIIKNKFQALFGSIIYISSSSHFMSLAWISGGATWIGFMFLSASFYSFISRREGIALLLFTAAILTSEAMLVGLILFLAWFIFIKEKREKFKIISAFFLISLLFLLVKFLLTPKVTYDVYKLSISFSNFTVLKYYILRTLNFGEINGDFIPTFLLVCFYLINAFLFIKHFSYLIRSKIVVIGFLITIAGLFPFILFTNHLSPNYMNISIFGLSLILAGILARVNIKLASFLLSVYIISSVITVKLNFADSWVIKRSNIAKSYIKKIERETLPNGSLIVFSNNEISSSSESYLALGTGKAVNFWFPDKNYKTCFTEFENCPLDNPSSYVIAN